MATNVITALGAADIDTKELVTNLVNATKEPRQKIIDEEKKKAEVAISSVGLLKSALTTLQSAATELGSLGKLNQISISSSDSSVVTASTSGTGVAKPGSYELTIATTAKPDRHVALMPGSLASSGSYTITTSRGEVTVSFDANDSPAVITQKINSNASLAQWRIRASLLETGDPTNPFAIAMESATGINERFTVTSAAGATGSNFMPVGDRATNATFTINGVTLTRTTNTIADAIPGATLQLNSPGENKRLTISNDSSKLVEKAQNFVDSYNLIREFLSKATGPRIEGDEIAGSLQSDVNARGILSRIRSTLVNESSSKSGSITHWSSLGVSLNRDGVLELNSEKLSAAFNKNPDDAIQALSSGASSPRLFAPATVPSGLAGDLARIAHQMTKSTGLIDSMESGFEGRLIRIDDKQVRLDSYVQRITAQYEKQFAALNAALSAFKNTQAQLQRSLNFDNNND
jgi:flagellar hook-associated protein 2